MSVVAPHVAAVHGMNCPDDCCNHDRFTDNLTTGEDIFDPEWPYKPVRMSPQRQSHARPARTGLRTLAMNAPAPAKTGRDGRAAGATSSQPSARSLSRAGTPHDEVTLGGGPSWGEPLAEPATSPSSSLVAGHENTTDMKQPSGGHRSAA